jgi:hydroxymethylpyrimidine pyrophosphatase-like HAD family hydrolase
MPALDGGPRPKLLAVDLDGTLLDTRGQPHERDVRAIRAALAEGVRVSIVTGRLYSGTRAFVETLGLYGAVACADGSHLVHAQSHTTLLHHGVRGGAATLLRDAVARARLATFVFARDAIGHDPSGAPFVDYVATWSRDIRMEADAYGHELWQAEDGVTAVVALGAREQVVQAVEDLGRDLPTALLVAMFPVRRGTHLGTWAIVARAAGTTKGTAIRWIANHEGVSLEETVCVGDWINDVPMFEVAGRSFAMGQAPDEVKAKASDVLPHTVEDGGGIAWAIESAFGIRTDP